MNSRGEAVSILVLVKSKTLWLGGIGNKTGVLGGWVLAGSSAIFKQQELESLKNEKYKTQVKYQS
jgi:hypothetical protein